MLDFLKNNAMTIIPIIASFGAMISSIKTYYLQKRQAYSSIFSSSRIEWISSVRLTLSKFIESYLEEQYLLPLERHKTITAKFMIDLHFDYGRGITNTINTKYVKVNAELISYLQAPPNNPIINHEPLVNAIQTLLVSAFLRAKMEAGITSNMEIDTWNKTQNLLPR